MGSGLRDACFLRCVCIMMLCLLLDLRYLILC